MMIRIFLTGLLLFGATPLDCAAQNVSLPDIPLVDQHATTITPAALVEEGEPIIVSFTYNGCTTVCPVSNLTMAALDAKPGQFRLLTITIDPLNDTPEAMAKVAADFAPSARWSWLSGDPRDVFGTLDRLGVRFGRAEDHPSYFLVFRDKGTRVLRLDRQSSASELLKAAMQEQLQ